VDQTGILAITPISYNIWIYSRRGALCMNIRSFAPF